MPDLESTLRDHARSWSIAHADAPDLDGAVRAVRGKRRPRRRRYAPLLAAAAVMVVAVSVAALTVGRRSADHPPSHMQTRIGRPVGHGQLCRPQDFTGSVGDERPSPVSVQLVLVFHGSAMCQVSAYAPRIDAFTPSGRHLYGAEDSSLVALNPDHLDVYPGDELLTRLTCAGTCYTQGTQPSTVSTVRVDLDPTGHESAAVTIRLHGDLPCCEGRVTWFDVRQVPDRGPDSVAGATIVGQLENVGGPRRGYSYEVPGTVYAYRNADRSGRPAAYRRTDPAGRFTLRLLPGRWYLGATSPKFQITPRPKTPPCFAAAPVVLTDGATARTTVICPMR